MHKKLFTLILVLATALTGACATMTTEPDYEVVLYSPDTMRAGAINPAATVYTTGEPTVTTYLTSRNARTRDGQIVSGVRLRSWEEGDMARVRAYALVPREGAPNVYTTDPAQLTEREIGTYVVAEGSSQRLCEMAAFGVEPYYIAYAPRTSRSGY